MTVIQASQVCTPTVDLFEDDDTYQTASLFDLATGTSVGHTFDSASDADWHQIALTAGLHYTLTANTANPAQLVSLFLYQPDGVTQVRASSNQLTYAPTASGNYYLRVTSGSGLGVSLCRSTYDLMLTRHNPNALPAPQPGDNGCPRVQQPPCAARPSRCPSTVPS